MKNFCIPKQFATKIKDALKGGEFEKLVEGTSKDRREFFERFVTKDIAKEINARLEKALVSNQNDALEKWVKENLSGVAAESAIKKIKNLTEILTAENEKDFMQDLASKKLGMDIDVDEAKEIIRIGKEIETIENKLVKVDEEGKVVFDHRNDPAFMEQNVEYWNKIADMSKFFQSIDKRNKWLRLSDYIVRSFSRANLLSAFKSAIVNIENNLILGVPRLLASRVISSGKRLGSDLAKDFHNMNMEIYKKTGFDTSRMTSFDEGVTMPGKIVGEGTANVPQFENKTGQKAAGLAQGYTDVVFKWLMGWADVKSASIHFAETANVQASRLALETGLVGDEAIKKTREIMLDAFSPNPKTNEGILVRAEAIADAQYYTGTHDTLASKFALGLRNLVDMATGPVKLGTFTTPFAKIPANFVSISLDHSGVRLAFDIGKSIVNRVKEGNFQKDDIRDLSRSLAKTAGGVGAAYIVTSLIEPEDFMGAYDPNRYKIDQLKDGTYNAVKIGDHWISLDYFGPIAAPMVGIMYAKKYGQPGVSKEDAAFYASGLFAQLGRIPGVAEGADLFSEFKASGKTSAEFAGKKFGEDIPEGFLDFVVNRMVPFGALVGDIAKSTDTYERQAKTPLEKAQAKIPGLREELPIKRKITGSPIKTEGNLTEGELGGLLALIAGARVKSDKSNDVEKEIFRLAGTGNTPSITDFYRSKSEKVKTLKERVSEGEFAEASLEYSTAVSAAFEKLLKDKRYQNDSDEGKKNSMNEIATSWVETIAKKHGVKAKPVSRKNENAYADKFKGK